MPTSPSRVGLCHLPLQLPEDIWQAGANKSKSRWPLPPFRRQAGCRDQDRVPTSPSRVGLCHPWKCKGTASVWGWCQQVQVAFGLCHHRRARNTRNGRSGANKSKSRRPLPPARADGISDLFVLVPTSPSRVGLCHRHDAGLFLLHRYGANKSKSRRPLPPGRGPQAHVGQACANKSKSRRPLPPAPLAIPLVRTSYAPVFERSGNAVRSVRPTVPR